MNTGSNFPTLPIKPTIATAPGKVILFGEHAVVYGRPAIAVPVTNVFATATVAAGEPGGGVCFVAADLPGPEGSDSGRRYSMREAPPDDPLKAIVELALAGFNPDDAFGDLLITVTSSIPIARGLGSGAAVATAVARAVARHFGHIPQPDQISGMVYEVEKLHHGTPSGIDNTVVAYEQPIFFARGKDLIRLLVGAPLSLVIADTGVLSSTRQVVGDVRRRWEAQPDRYEALFDEIGIIVQAARASIEGGDAKMTGRLMDENHQLLASLGVSSPELEGLVQAARAAGALGAKLSGAGWGGNMLALVEPDRATGVAGALRDAGATSTIYSQVT